MKTAMKFKQPAGIDAIVEEYKGGAVDVRRDAVVKGNPVIEDVLSCFKKILSQPEYSSQRVEPLEAYHDINFVLTPQEIKVAAFACFDYFLKNLEKEGASKKTGGLITKLIQNSYDAGYNGFTINTTFMLGDHDGSLLGLGAYLQGKKENSLKIIVEGDADSYAFWRSAFIKAHIKGSVGMCSANGSTDISLYVDKDVRSHSFQRVSNSKAFIKGNVFGDFGKDSYNSRAFIQGNRCYYDFKGGIVAYRKWERIKIEGSKNCIFDFRKYKKVIRT